MRWPQRVQTSGEAVAVLHEAADFVDDLNRAGIKGRLANTAKWDQLRATARRWEKDERLKTFRDKIQFHVDREVMRAGAAKNLRAKPRRPYRDHVW